MAVADRFEQSRHEVAMHRACVAARTVLQYAEAVDDDIDLVGAKQLRQVSDIHRHQWQLEIGCAHLLCSRELPRDPDRVKAARPQIVGEVASDQARRAKHEDIV